MMEIEIKYNPFSDSSEIKVDGEIPQKSSNLNRHNKIFQEWIAELPEILLDECYTRTFNVTFYGVESDYEKIKAVLDSANTKGFKFNKIAFIEMVSSKDKFEKVKELLNKISLACANDDFIKIHIENSNLNNALQNTANIIDENKVLGDVNNCLSELEVFIEQEIKSAETQKELLVSKLYADKQNIQKLKIEKTNIKNFSSTIINESFEDAKSEANKLIEGIVNELREIAAKEIKKKSKKFYEDGVQHTIPFHKANETDIRTVELKNVKFLIKKILNTEKELENKAAAEINEIIKNKFNDIIKQYKGKKEIFDENLKVARGGFKFSDKEWLFDSKVLESCKIKIIPKSYIQKVLEPLIPQPITPHNEFMAPVYNEIKVEVLINLFIEKMKLNSLVNKAEVNDFLLNLVNPIKKIFDESLVDFDKKIEKITSEISSNEKEQDKINDIISAYNKCLIWSTDIKKNIEAIMNC